MYLDQYWYCTVSGSVPVHRESCKSRESTFEIKDWNMYPAIVKTQYSVLTVRSISGGADEQLSFMSVDL